MKQLALNLSLPTNAKHDNQHKMTTISKQNENKNSNVATAPSKKKRVVGQPYRSSAISLKTESSSSTSKRGSNKPKNNNCAGSVVTEQSFVSQSSNTFSSFCRDSQDQEKQCTLLSARYRKKQAERNSIVLSNRISLLKKEEERAKKKIQAAKARAEDIVAGRHQHLYDAIERERILLQKERDLAREREAAERSEEGKRQRRLHQGEMVLRKRLEDAESVRRERVLIRKDLERQKKACIENNKKKHADVKEKEEALKRQKQIIEENQRRLNKQMYEEKLKQEESKIKQQKREVARLEKVEKKLIRQLKSTQLKQQEAFDDLENTIREDIFAALGEEESESVSVSESGSAASLSEES
mmetsp:Transcript_41717/g.50800  ORF Transcript_41717/g.50800 Transcript_41717/m.50800 type:complete len:356 (-) Transcript_41717:162-1229(-)